MDDSNLELAAGGSKAVQSGGRPKLSVVVITRNRAGLLREALESLSRQSIPLQDIVVIDDGGTEPVRQMVEGMGARYAWQENAGQQAARNAGTALAEGDWIAYLDDDDLWEPDRHELILQLAQTGDVDLVFGNFVQFGEGWVAQQSSYEIQEAMAPGFWGGTAWKDGRTVSVVGRFPALRLFPQCPFWPSTIAIRRDLFDHLGGWDTRLRGIRTEDFDFAFRATRAGRLGLIWKPTLRYRSHPGNHSQLGARVSLGRAGVWRHLLRYADLDAGERIAIQESVRSTLLEAHWSAFQARDHAMVWRVTEELGGWSQLPMGARVKALWSRVALGPRRRST